MIRIALLTGLCLSLCLFSGMTLTASPGTPGNPETPATPATSGALGAPKSQKSPESSEYHDAIIQPREGDAFAKAEYRIWLPEGVDVIRGIIFKQHGCGPGARKQGREHANDLQWQALARKWDCALMGSRIWTPPAKKGKKEDCSTWTMPADGSEHAFFTALNRFAKASGHEELKTVPWALWGHSGGAAWILNMIYRHPHRVMAAVPKSGSLPRTDRTYLRSQPLAMDSNPEVLKVPMLVCVGALEKVPDQRFYNMTVAVGNMIAWGRKQNAPWGISIHPGCGHENLNTRSIAIRYLDACLAHRLPSKEVVRSNKVPTLKRLSLTDGYLVHSKGYRRAHKNVASHDWVPSESLAKDWIELHQSGDIKDTSPPPAPTGIQVKEVDGKVTISWSCHADMESGIHKFHLLRDGKKVGTLGGKVIKKFNPKGSFLYWNYSDQPYMAAYPMVWADTSEGASVAARYTVKAENRSGLMSE